MIFHWGSFVLLWASLHLYYLLCPRVSLSLHSCLGRPLTSLQKGWFPKNYRRDSSHGGQKLYHVTCIPFYLSGEVKVSPDSREEERNSPATREKILCTYRNKKNCWQSSLQKSHHSLPSGFHVHSNETVLCHFWLKVSFGDFFVIFYRFWPNPKPLHTLDIWLTQYFGLFLFLPIWVYLLKQFQNMYMWLINVLTSNASIWILINIRHHDKIWQKWNE